MLLFSIDVCIEIKLTTRVFASEISWSFGLWCNSSQQYQDHQEVTQTCCFKSISDWKHELVCKDSNNDGWNGAYISINGRKFCDDFLEGHEKEAIVEAKPSKNLSSNQLIQRI